MTNHERYQRQLTRLCRTPIPAATPKVLTGIEQELAEQDERELHELHELENLWRNS